MDTSEVKGHFLSTYWPSMASAGVLKPTRMIQLRSTEHMRRPQPLPSTRRTSFHGWVDTQKGEKQAIMEEREGAMRRSVIDLPRPIFL